MHSQWPRIIMHADMDAFFASVEQLDNPALRGKPVLVGHLSKRSVVSTASYEARPFGVGSAMPMAHARRLCPQAIVVPPRIDRYVEISTCIMEVLAKFSPLVEPLSLDEAFLDMTGASGIFGAPAAMGSAVKQAVHQATGLTVSVGIANTKFVAKVASDYQKPDGLTVVAQNEVDGFLRPLPVRRLWGIGPRAAETLNNVGLHTIGDIAATKLDVLVALLGKLGGHVHDLAHNYDPRAIETERSQKSIGHEETLDRDIASKNAAAPLLLRAADRVAERLRAQELLALGVRVKLKTAGFELMTRQRRLPGATSSANPLYASAVALLDDFPWNEPVRLVGLAAYDLSDEHMPTQQDLFPQTQLQRQHQLDIALDSVRARFGDRAILRASELPTEHATRHPRHKGH